jgi:hypothetical protein
VSEQKLADGIQRRCLNRNRLKEFSRVSEQKQADGIQQCLNRNRLM